MILLITGSEGFIGRHVAEAAIEAGYEVDKLDRIFGEDIADKHAYGYDAIINCAGVAGVRRSFYEPAEYWRENSYAAAVLFQDARRCGVPVVHASTSLASYPEHSPYAASKAAAEQQVLFENRLGANISIVRIYNVYGPGQPEPWLVPTFMRSAREERPFCLENGGNQLADYIYVTDVAQALLAAMDMNVGIHHAGSGNFASPRDIAEIIANLAGIEPVYEDAIAPLRQSIPVSPDLASWGDWWETRVSLKEGLDKTWWLTSGR